MENLLHLPEIGPRFLRCWTRSLVNIPITYPDYWWVHKFVLNLSLDFCDLRPNFNCRGIVPTYVTLKPFPRFDVHCSCHLQGKWNGKKANILHTDLTSHSFSHSTTYVTRSKRYDSRPNTKASETTNTHAQRGLHTNIKYRKLKRKQLGTKPVEESTDN